ncbi:MAG: hypothetical protein FWD45_00765 [Coriobacteriia bacterium]|nr:hypothetical protein [Coriobacteriia bacterium]
MKARTKFLSVVVSVAATVALCFGLIGQVFAANTDVEITSCFDADDVSTVIQNAIDASANGDTVTVIGSIDLGEIDYGVQITIPAEITVIWKAEASGDLFGCLVEVIGDGIFRMDAGAIVATNGDAADAIACHDSLVEIIVGGGLVKVVAPSGSAIYSHSGDITINGGTVLAIGDDEVNAIFTYYGIVTVTAGTVKAEGKNAAAIANWYSYVNITGGIISAEGEDSFGIWLGYALARIVGGSVSATGVDSNAIYVNGYGGAAVYLAGTVTGGLFVLDDVGSGVGYGVIIEAGVWNIASEDIGTKNDMTIKAIGSGTDPDNEFSEFDYYWEGVDAHSVCITLDSVRPEFPGFAEAASYNVPWGGYRADQPKPPTTPGTGDMTVWIITGAFVLLAAGAGSLTVYRRR